MSDSITTQVCPSCPEKGEQPLSNFHRRRNSFQKICRACRNASARSDYQARGKARLPHTPTQINTANFPALQERIVNLDSRLRALASMFAQDRLDADDVYSEMVEAILTKCNPSELDSYILGRAHFTAQAYVEKRLTYSHYVDSLDPDLDTEISVGFKVVNTRSVEDELVQMETYKALQAAIESLPAENQKVVSMLAVGMNQRQISEKLGVTEQSISERMKTIRRFFYARNMGTSFA